MKRWQFIVASALATAAGSVLLAFAVYLGIQGASSRRWSVPADVLLATGVYGLAAIAFVLPLSLVLLRPTQLRRTIPTVAAVTIAMTAAGSIGDALFGLLVGLAGGIVTMLVVALIPTLREPTMERRRLGATL